MEQCCCDVHCNIYAQIMILLMNMMVYKLGKMLTHTLKNYIDEQADTMILLNMMSH